MSALPSWCRRTSRSYQTPVLGRPQSHCDHIGPVQLRDQFSKRLPQRSEVDISVRLRLGHVGSPLQREDFSGIAQGERRQLRHDDNGTDALAARERALPSTARVPPGR